MSNNSDGEIPCFGMDVLMRKTLVPETISKRQDKLTYRL